MKRDGNLPVCAAIEEEFDHVEHYLERAVGLDAAAREILRSRFLE